ncbi:MAG: hypothetical protein AB3N24_15265, partial [Leisingera sp.]
LFKANVQESLKISYSDREWSFREESEYGEFTIGEGPFAFGIHFRRTEGWFSTLCPTCELVEPPLKD